MEDKDNLSEFLISLKKQFHSLEYLYPDPLYCVRQVKLDQEAWAFVAACFSYGRVELIMEMIKLLIKENEEDFFQSNREPKISKPYRFYSVKDITRFLAVLRSYYQKNGGLKPKIGSDSALEHGHELYKALRNLDPDLHPHLISPHVQGSAQKRLSMFLRWMVRKDHIDLGLWEGIKTSSLIMPIDTHIQRNCQILGITQRKQADFKTAEEITSFFRSIDPLDPVSFDFVLSRIGIHPELKKIDLKSIVF